MTVDEATWARYRTWALTDGGQSPRTHEKSARYLRFLEKQGVPLAAFTRPDWLARLAVARESGRAPYTLNVWVTQLNRWARFRGHDWRLPSYRHHHVPDVPAPTREQVERLWALEWADPSTTSRNRALIAVLADKGIRRQEIVDLNLSDFVQSRKGPTLVVRHGKGEKERRVPVAPQVAQLIREYVGTFRVRSDSVALFTTARGRLSHPYLGNLVQRAGARAGMPWLSCHKLRHFAVDDMLDRGASVTSVAEMVGHEKVETTMIYRTKRLNRLYAENEVRALDRGRFRAPGAPKAPAKARGTGTVAGRPNSRPRPRPPPPVLGFKSGRTTSLDEWTGRGPLLWPGRLPECEPGLTLLEAA